VRVDHLFAAARRAGLRSGIAGSTGWGTLFPGSPDARILVEDPHDYRNAEAAYRTSADVTAAALRFLDQDLQLVLVHLPSVDILGHGFGGTSAQYAEAARRVDGHLAAILQAVDLATTTAIVTADHGHIDTGGHGGWETVVKQVPLVLAGAGVRRGVRGGDVRQADIAPTVAALLGTAIPAHSQGRPLVEAGVIGRYVSPERAFLDAHLKDEKGYWTAFFSRHLVFAYNTTLVPAARLPKTYFDLLDPYWKGKLAIDDHPGNWLAGMVKAYGKEKATELLQGVVRQAPKIIRGRTLKGQLLAAGEFHAAVDQTEESVIEIKKKGAPVDYALLENTPVLTNPVLLAKNAPHPYAAALFVDYLLSSAGQQAVVDIDYVPTRQGFKPKNQELAARAAKAKLVFFDLDWFGERQKEINDLIKENLRPHR